LTQLVALQRPSSANTLLMAFAKASFRITSLDKERLMDARTKLQTLVVSVASSIPNARSAVIDSIKTCARAKLDLQHLKVSLTKLTISLFSPTIHS